MKNLIFTLTLLGSGPVMAGPSISGGVPPAPRAVVLQGHLVAGSFDLVGRAQALELAATHLRHDRVYVIAQRPELQYPDRSYICIEYKSWDEANIASAEFKNLLKDSPSIEVVSNGSCR